MDGYTGHFAVGTRPYDSIRRQGGIVPIHKKIRERRFQWYGPKTNPALRNNVTRRFTELVTDIKSMSSRTLAIKLNTETNILFNEICKLRAGWQNVYCASSRDKVTSWSGVLPLLLEIKNLAFLSDVPGRIKGALQHSPPLCGLPWHVG